MNGRIILLCWAAIALSSCFQRTLPASHPPLRPLPARAGPLEVGAARVDITPPPGLSLFGHGPESGVAVGYWMRLYCRAIYIRSAQDRRDVQL